MAISCSMLKWRQSFIVWSALFASFNIESDNSKIIVLSLLREIVSTSVGSYSNYGVNVIYIYDNCDLSRWYWGEHEWVCFPFVTILLLNLKDTLWADTTSKVYIKNCRCYYINNWCEVLYKYLCLGTKYTVAISWLNGTCENRWYVLLYWYLYKIVINSFLKGIYC